MKIKITADSTCDLSEEIIKRYNIGIIPVRIIMDNKEYADGVDISIEKLFELVEKTGQLSQTAATNPTTFQEFFDKQLKSDGGYDAIIHFDISSKISSLYQNAQIASQEFDNKVFVVDSQSLSTGVGIQMLYACDLVAKGLPADEIYEKIMTRRPAAQASFIIDTLKFLHKGGRCSGLAMFGANLLKIKPIIVLKDGILDVDAKPRGKYKEAVMKYVDYILDKFSNPDKTRCFLTYTTLDNEILKMIYDRIKPIFKEIHITRAGCTVATHCGPNTVGILYYSDGGAK